MRSDIELVLASREDLDLRDQRAVARFFDSRQIDQVYLAAAKVGGIVANRDFPAEFISENLSIQSNIIEAAHRADVERLMFIASSAIYPRHTVQPIPENALLTGELDPSHEPYILAKIAGMKMCQAYHRQYCRDFRCVVPTNLYGPGDNFHPEHSHVIPGLIRRFWEANQNDAEEIIIWGSGKPRREFLHVDDMASACIHLMQLDADKFYPDNECTTPHYNIGSGEDHSIAAIAEIIAKVSKFRGRLRFDTSMPDGVPRKLLNSSRLHALSWRPQISLEKGLKALYYWYSRNAKNMRN